MAPALPIHPRTGLQAIGIVGGRPVWPVLGAEDNPPSADPPPADPPKPATGEDALGDAGKKALDAMKAERNEAQRQLKTMQRELEQLRQQQMSESEKAIAEAEQRGRQTATVEVGQRLARAEFLAAAAKRNAEHDATSILDDLNLGKYVGDDGEPDVSAIGKAVERLIPAAAADPRPRGDAGLGPRPTAPPADPRLADLQQIEADLIGSRRK